MKSGSLWLLLPISTQREPRKEPRNVTPNSPKKSLPKKGRLNLSHLMPEEIAKRVLETPSQDKKKRSAKDVQHSQDDAVNARRT